MMAYPLLAPREGGVESNEGDGWRKEVHSVVIYNLEADATTSSESYKTGGFYCSLPVSPSETILKHGILAYSSVAMRGAPWVWWHHECESSGRHYGSPIEQ